MGFWKTFLTLPVAVRVVSVVIGGMALGTAGSVAVLHTQDDMPSTAVTSSSTDASATTAASANAGSSSATTTGVSTSTSAVPATTSAGVPVIYVNIASHSEDGTTPGYPDFSTDKASFDTERAGVVAFANMIAQHQAKYDYQSDWNFLLGVQKYDAGDASTNGKNVLRYLSEDLGFAVDPHSHEKNGYNYADVAYLIKANGVEPSHVVGGFIASPADQSKLSYLSTLTHGSKYPTYEWKPEILWGGGTGNHVNESALWISGIWHPKSASSYAVDDPSAPLPVVGHYESGWNGLDQLLALQGEGKLTEGNIYTVTIMSDQPDFTDSYVSAFSAKLDEYADETAAGKIVWATIEETYDAWVDSYGSKASILPWSGTTTADSGPSAHSSTGGSSSGSSLPPKGGSSGSASGGSLLDPSVKANCGNGTCDKLEKTSGLCPTDCS